MSVDKDLYAVLKRNPWATVAKDWLAYPTKEYVLPEDVAKLKGAKDCEIHLELPPQPFIGDPNAPLWVLHLCPGYSETDIYDMVSIEKKPLGTPVKENCTKKAFDKRRKAIFGQLDFSAPHFYVLEKPFCTIMQDDKRQLQGTYGWWYNQLFEKGEPLFQEGDENKIFVLEFFPYHCKTDSKRKIGNPSDSIMRTTLHYKKFWWEMVRYAIDSGRKILARQGLATKICKHVGIEKMDNVYVFSSSQNMSISEDNVLPYRAYKSGNRSSEQKKIAVSALRRAVGYNV